MNKLKLIGLFLMTTLVVYPAQDKVEVTKATYVYTNKNPDLTSTMLWDLYVYKNKGIIQKKTSTEVDVINNEDVNVYSSDWVYEPYQLLNHKEKKFLFYGMIGDNNFYIEDIYPDVQWKISNETKTIFTYSCVKATTTYRGRIWTAWFSPEVAVPFGPWKLHGLPGLIIEAVDSTGNFSFSLTSLNNEKSTLFSQDFNTLMETKNKIPITYQQFLKDSDEYSANIRKKMIAKYGGTITVTKNRESQLEKEYEWDNEE